MVRVPGTIFDPDEAKSGTAAGVVGGRREVTTQAFRR